MKPISHSVLMILGCLFLTTQASMAEDIKRPNVIMFLVDDMGWMDCTPYGSQYYDTPQMARLAREGMRFTQAYAQPLCSPTRASLLSGQYSARHRITSAVGHTAPQIAKLESNAPMNRPLRMPESQTFLEPAQYTLAEALRDQGYRTGHFGKWHLGLTQPHWPEAQGFDVAFHCEPSAGPPNAYFSPYGVLSPNQDLSQLKGKRVLGTITDGPDGEYITDRLTDEALKFISANRDQPFFLNLWHYGVHGPWGHKESLTEQMAARRDPTGRQDNPVMASMLKSIDESLGRILRQLDDLGLADNTIIVFNSDNGGNIHSNTIDDAKSQRRNREDATAASYRKWAGQKPPTNNAPLRDGKGRLYEGGVRVPLIVRWPGKVKANKTNESIVGCIDFYPTILELTGITPKVNQKIDGRSYAGELLGTKAFDRDTYFIWFPHLVPGVSVRKGDWKLIRRFEERPSEYQGTRELFNLRQDLGETKNLAAEQPEKVKELDKLIDAFLQDTDALLPQPNPGYKPVSNSKTSPIDVAGTVEELIKGLVTQQSKATRLADGIRVEATGKRPYLGTAAVKLNGPLTLRLRVRSEHGGTGEVKWRTADEAEFPRNGPSVEFAIQPSPQWQEVDVALPIEGTSAIIQLHLPAQSGPVDLQQIEYQDARGHKKGWTFVATPVK